MFISKETIVIVLDYIVDKVWLHSGLHIELLVQSAQHKQQDEDDIYMIHTPKLFESILGCNIRLMEYFSGVCPLKDSHLWGIHASFVATPPGFPCCGFQDNPAENKKEQLSKAEKQNPLMC